MLSGVPSDRNKGSQLFVSLSICSTPENDISESPKLFYYLGGVPDSDHAEIWKESSIEDTFKAVNPSLVGLVSKTAYADYYFGYRVALIDLAALKKGDSIYLAVNGKVGIEYQLGYSNIGFPDLLLFNFTTQLLDTSDRAASILINNRTISNFDSAVFYYAEFNGNRRFNSLCSIQATPKINRIPANSGNFEANIRYLLPTISKNKDNAYYEAYLYWLDSDTPYVGWLTIPSSKEASSGITFPPVYFRTKKKNPKCFLARNFDTCENVYHSVYIPDTSLTMSTVPVSELAYRSWTSKYIKEQSEFVERHYSAFVKALEQYDCIEHPYSPVRDCNDCRVSYKNWLCAIAFPKCGQPPDHMTKLIGTAYFENIDGGITIKPCAFICHFVIQDCPSRLRFRCPVVGEKIDKYMSTEKGVWSWAHHELQFRKYPFSSNVTPPILETEFCNHMLAPLRLPDSEAIFRSSSLTSQSISLFSLLILLSPFSI